MATVLKEISNLFDLQDIEQQVQGGSHPLERNNLRRERDGFRELRMRFTQLFQYSNKAHQNTR